MIRDINTRNKVIDECINSRGAKSTLEDHLDKIAGRYYSAIVGASDLEERKQKVKSYRDFLDASLGTGYTGFIKDAFKERVVFGVLVKKTLDYVNKSFNAESGEEKKRIYGEFQEFLGKTENKSVARLEEIYQSELRRRKGNYRHHQ